MSGPEWPTMDGRTLAEAICLSRCGSYARFYSMMQHFMAGTCPFDLDNGFDPKVNEVIHKNDHFQVWVVGGIFNRKSDQLDLYALIVPIEHLETITSQNQSFWADLGEAVDWVCTEFQIPGGMFGARFGDVRYTAATEQHLHFFIKVPNLKKEVREPIAKSLQDVLENTLRGKRYEDIYHQGVTPKEFAALVQAGVYNAEGKRIS